MIVWKWTCFPQCERTLCRPSYRCLSQALFSLGGLSVRTSVGCCILHQKATNAILPCLRGNLLEALLWKKQNWMSEFMPIAKVMVFDILAGIGTAVLTAA